MIQPIYAGLEDRLEDIPDPLVWKISQASWRASKNTARATGRFCGHIAQNTMVRETAKVIFGLVLATVFLPLIVLLVLLGWMFS